MLVLVRSPWPVCCSVVRHDGPADTITPQCEELKHLFRTWLTLTSVNVTAAVSYTKVTFLWFSPPLSLLRVSISGLLSPDVLRYLCHVFFCANHRLPALINGGAYPRGRGAGVQLRAQRRRKRIPSWNAKLSPWQDPYPENKEQMRINEWDYFPAASWLPKVLIVNVGTCYAAQTSNFNLFNIFFLLQISLQETLPLMKTHQLYGELFLLEHVPKHQL